MQNRVDKFIPQASRIVVGSVCVLMDKSNPVNDGLTVLVDDLYNENGQWWATVEPWNTEQTISLPVIDSFGTVFNVEVDRIDVKTSCLVTIAEIELETE